MQRLLSIFALMTVVGFVLLVLLVIVRLGLRNSYVERLSSLPEAARARLLRHARLFAALFRISFWTIILITISLLPALLFFMRVLLPVATAWMLLVAAATLEECWYHNWLVNSLDTTKLEP